MKVSCSKCGQGFSSHNVIAEQAFMEIQTKSSVHIKERHPAMFQEMQKTLQAVFIQVTMAMHNEEFITIPEEEEKYVDFLDRAEQVVMAAIGLEAGTEEIEEGKEVGPTGPPTEPPAPVAQSIV